MYVLAEHPWFLAASAAYAAATAAYAATWRSTRALVARVATGLMCAAIALNAALIAGRWISAERPPFKSLFESLVFFSFTTGVVYLVMERLHRTRVFGALAALMSFGCLAYAVAHWDAEVVKLPPALQSPWFVPHVVVYFVGYGAMAFATVAAALQLLAGRSAFFARLTRVKAGTALTGALDLEQVTFDAIRFGFVLLTFGLLVGSVWAKSAWGDFWVWDPKENWSLVTWLVYGAYLHLRRVKGWRGRRAAWLAVLGFAVVLFTYLGMGLLPSAEESVHVYTQSSQS
ncbi:MAG TPA: c-type cytochrome biogenesis protein CcsB [Anaeromyxobacteraceae bacterium]|nr:c-type cytochrome biogenesis protein CcsB [Anaeromyxobacteraceae bacterium]